MMSIPESSLTEIQFEKVEDVRDAGSLVDHSTGTNGELTKYYLKLLHKKSCVCLTDRRRRVTGGTALIVAQVVQRVPAAQQVKLQVSFTYQTSIRKT